MPEEIERESGWHIAERLLGGWRIVASAWLVAMVFVVMLAGVQALASRHGVSAHAASLAGAVIPRHDPSCAGPAEMTTSAPQSCQADEQAVLDRAEAESYSGW